MPENTTPPTSGSGNKMWYIIGAIIVLLLLGWVISRGVGGAAIIASGGTPNLDGSATYTDNEGNTVTVGSSSMPENWPSDAPQNYAGASIRYSGNSNPQTGKAGAAVVYTANASVKSVYDYYDSRLKAEGWTIDATASVAAGANVIAATKNGRTFGVYIVSTGANTVSVTAGLDLQ